MKDKLLLESLARYLKFVKDQDVQFLIVELPDIRRIVENEIHEHPELIIVIDSKIYSDNQLIIDFLTKHGMSEVVRFENNIQDFLSALYNSKIYEKINTTVIK